jgi:hypothetical protein
MKYLKRFNEELSPRIYNIASRKLDKMGMPKRAKALKDWSNIQQTKQNMADWRENIEDLKEFGTFGFTIKGEDGQELITDDFYLYIDFDDFAFEDQTIFEKDKYVNGVTDTFSTTLFLMTGLVPMNEDTVQKCEEVLPDADNLSNGFYWANCISIKMEIKNDKVTLGELKFESYDPSVSGNPLVADRRSAVKLKNLIKSIFLNEVNYPSGRTDVKYIYELMENSILNKCGFSGDYGFELKEVADLIQKTHISQFPGYIE